MPDLRSELMKLEHLKFDDDVADAPAPITQQTTNVTQKIWEAVKANPNSSTVQIAQKAMDGNPQGVATRLNQLIKRNLITRVAVEGTYRYTAVGDTYPKLNRIEIVAKAQAVKTERRLKREKQREYNAKYKAKKETSTAGPLAVSPASLTSSPNAEQIVNSMSVGLAKAVYLELKKVFEA